MRTPAAAVSHVLCAPTRHTNSHFCFAHQAQLPQGAPLLSMPCAHCPCTLALVLHRESLPSQKTQTRMPARGIWGVTLSLWGHWRWRLSAREGKGGQILNTGRCICSGLGRAVRPALFKASPHTQGTGMGPAAESGTCRPGQVCSTAQQSMERQACSQTVVVHISSADHGMGCHCD
jgi:hypothetical protein